MCVCVSFLFLFIVAFVVVVHFFLHTCRYNLAQMMCSGSHESASRKIYSYTHTHRQRNGSSKQIDGVQQTVKTMIPQQKHSMSKREREREVEKIHDLFVRACECARICAPIDWHSFCQEYSCSFSRERESATKNSGDNNDSNRRRPQINARSNWERPSKKTNNKSGCYHESNRRTDYTFIVHKMKLTTIRDLIWTTASNKSHTFMRKRRCDRARKKTQYSPNQQHLFVARRKANQSIAHI